MSRAASLASRPWPGRVARRAFDLTVGGVLCLHPLTSVIALGWLQRRMAVSVARRSGQDAADPEWLLGPRAQGRAARLLGGLAANIRAGLIAAAGLAALTLPFTALWLGAWWAGWENSFNKGYEQAAVGPALWLLGCVAAAPVLALLPVILCHAAVQNRLSAFFELRRAIRIAAAAGWRLAALALATVVLMLPLVALRALPVILIQVLPPETQSDPEAVLAIAGKLRLAGAAYGFAALLVLRQAAAAIVACAARHDAPAGRLRALVWIGAASVICLGLVPQILVGQFMNYAPLFWLTHPAFLLPYPG